MAPLLLAATGLLALGIATAILRSFGPGYRVYFVNRGGELILLLCGGDKSSQARDIEAAKRLAREED